MVELLVSLVILSVGIMGVAQLFNISSAHTMSGDKELAAASLVQEMREKILSETFDDVPSIFDGVDTAVENSVTEPCQAWAQHITDHLGVEGRGQIDVLEPDDDPEVLYGMLGAVITVSWPEQGETRDLTLRFVTTKIGF
jgi:hypothetical protein